MVLAVFPAGLPQAPLLGGLEFAKMPNSIIFQTETGDPIGRRRFTGKRKIVSFVFPQMSDAQRDTFDTFYDTTLIDGNLSFTWTDFETGETGVTYKFTDPRPVSKPTSPDSNGDMQWKISATILRIY